MLSFMHHNKFWERDHGQTVSIIVERYATEGEKRQKYKIEQVIGGLKFTQPRFR